MVSPQSIYLRKKNEELLHELKENARHLNRKVEICSELLRGRPRYCEEEFTELRCTTPKMSPIAKFNPRERATSPEMSLIAKFNRRTTAQPVKILHASNPRSMSVGHVSSYSTGRLRSPRRGHSTCVPSQPISCRSSSEGRWSKFQQDLASHAHMHGFTLSHAQSKCYCTRNEESEPVASFSGSRTGADPLKTRIPPRLKEKRDQARSPQRRPCNVKWAVPNDDEASDQLPEDIYNIHLPIGDSDQENNQQQSRSFCGSACALDNVPMRVRSGSINVHGSENSSDWFVKMKNFRKSNWDDCHAPDRQDKSGCKRNNLYMVGERLFLEPVHTSAMNGESCCCSKPQEEEDPTPPPTDTVVTLPKVHSEVKVKPQRSKEDNSVSTKRAGLTSGMYKIDGPCFLTGHKTKKDDDRLRALVLQKPAESFALRYQKGVDPRRL